MDWSCFLCALNSSVQTSLRAFAQSNPIIVSRLLRMFWRERGPMFPKGLYEAREIYALTRTRNVPSGFLFASIDSYSGKEKIKKAA
jgi:hypothetical protein